MTTQRRSAFWLSLLLLLALSPYGADAIQASLQNDSEPVIQEPAQSQAQTKASEEELAQAGRLSITVVELFAAEKYDEALPIAKRVVEMRENVLGPDHEMVQRSLLNLSEIYMSLKKYGDAQKITERILSAYEQRSAPEDAAAARILDKLAFLAYMQRDFSRSEAAYNRALAIREKIFGKDHAEFGNSLYSLAEFYRLTRKFEKAQALYEQALVLRMKLLGREHPIYLKARERYFCLAHETHQGEKLNDFVMKLEIRDNNSKSNVGENAVLNGRALSLPKPKYPDDARNARAKGVVVVKVMIDERGTVIDAADMCGGHPLLVKPSLEAAWKARFTPTKLSGQPVKVTGVITYNFVEK